MPTFRATRSLCFFLIALFQINKSIFSQISGFPISEWPRKLESKNDTDNKIFVAIRRQLYQYDSAMVFNILKELDKKASKGSHYFNARLFALKVHEHHRFFGKDAVIAVRQFCEQGLKEAFRTGDEQFISFISWEFGQTMFVYEQLELSALYSLNAVEADKDIMEKPHNYFNASILGGILFQVREYEKSIYYTRKAIDNCPDTSAHERLSVMTWYNTLGQGYQNTGRLDSAVACYKKSLQRNERIKSKIWQGINLGFLGETYFIQKKYKEAKPLFEYEYNATKDTASNDWDLNIAGYALQWMARINLIEGKKDSALLQAKEALNLLQRPNNFPWQNKNYLEQVYYTTADIYRASGKNDSFYHYFQLYSALHDSLQRIAVRSSADLAQMRIDNQKNYQAIQTLQRQKQTEKLIRNFSIAAIIMLTVISMLILNRQRQKLKFKQILALQEKTAEITAAKEQLSFFTQSMMEKSDLIEDLKARMQAKELNAEGQLVKELSNHTILTEEEWEKFKILFQKIYPDFFLKLKQRVQDITAAEQRMAALTRMHLETKQVAAILGISPDSVYKTRQRLRARLQLGTHADIESFLSNL